MQLVQKPLDERGFLFFMWLRNMNLKLNVWVFCGIAGFVNSPQNEDTIHREKACVFKFQS